MRTKLSAITLLALLATLTPATARPRTFLVVHDGARVSRNILPPGTGGYLGTADFALVTAGAAEQPDHFADQLGMYENLVVAASDGVTPGEVATLFKDARFGVRPDDVGRTYSPRGDVTIVRDLSFNVPHIFGTTREGTMFGAGYASAEDRLFMMDTLRHIARGRMSEFLGASEANLASDRATYAIADYTEEELQAMAGRLPALAMEKTGSPELGQLVLDDFAGFAAGVNQAITEMLLDPTRLPAEYPALQLVPEPWKITDSVALASMIGGVFSVGGGGQLANDRLLDALEAEYPGDAARARSIFDDFKNANDPEAPTNTSERFPFNTDRQLGPVDPDAVARPDDTVAFARAMERASFPPALDGPFGPIRIFARRGQASNALLVAPDRSASGNPIAVFGPQVGYYAPEILSEIDIHGPGVHARGAAFPGISQYVLLGRGQDYAWSATTAVADHVDIRAVKLCDTGGGEAALDSDGYLRDGECHPIYTRTDTWVAKPGAAGTPDGDGENDVVVSMTAERALAGAENPTGQPVASRGFVDGEPVAFVRVRSSYGKEVDSAISYVLLHDPSRIDTVDDMLHAFGDWFSFSFNWHVIARDGVGFITTGLYPRLQPGVDPEMPFWGEPEWDYAGLLAFDEHPQSNNPPEGFITNWNNKQAPAFRASDDNYSYGSIQRKQLLTDGVLRAMRRDGLVSVPELVEAMAVAATQDLRVEVLTPRVLEAIGRPSDPGLAAGYDLLADWIGRGAHRADLDGDGAYDDADAALLMDAMWSPLMRAIFGDELGAAFEVVPQSHNEGANPGGSAYWGGWYGHASKALRTSLGLAVRGAYNVNYCGTASECRDAFYAALAEGMQTASETKGNNENWAFGQKAAEDIQFSAVGVLGQRAMHWQNRPTFQQVVEFPLARAH
ncbi:MAG TPA: penicillin acylase family protein [Actinomycetota bacterium]